VKVRELAGLLLWVKAAMIFKRPDGWINLLVEAAHALGDVCMDAVA